jgi:hypothetical protein
MELAPRKPERLMGGDFFTILEVGAKPASIGDQPHSSEGHLNAALGGCARFLDRERDRAFGADHPYY